MTDDTTTDGDNRVERLTNIIEQQNERINQLEDVVQQQAQAIWPTRRQALKATGAAAIFGAGAIGGAAGAPGDDGDTVWGSDQNRDDYYVDEMDANLVSTDDVKIDGSDFVASGDTFGAIGFLGDATDASVSSDTYTPIAGSADIRLQHDLIIPANATARWAIGGAFQDNGDQIDVRLRNATDGETILEATNLSGNNVVSDTYTPTTTGSHIRVFPELRNADNATTVEWQSITVTVGVDV